jgi:hypothetical protein
MSSLTRGRDIARQAWYAVFRHTRGNPETRFTETYLYRCTLSTLPADDTLALLILVGAQILQALLPLAFAFLVIPGNVHVARGQKECLGQCALSDNTWYRHL